MGLSDKNTYDSKGHESLRDWVDAQATEAARGSVPNRFWAAARVAILDGFPDAKGNPLLQEPGKRELTEQVFEDSYEIRTKRFSPDFVRGEDPDYDRFWTLISNVNRYLSRLYYGQTKMVCFNRAHWFETRINPETMRINASAWMQQIKDA